MDKSKHQLLFVIGGLAIGGAETHLSLILPELVKRGWDVKLVTFTEHNDLGPALEAKGVKLIRLFRRRFSGLPGVLRRPLRFMQTLFLLCREIKREPLAISHYFLPESYMIGMIAAFLSNEKSLKIMSRRSLNRYKSRRFGLVGSFETTIHPFCDFVLANSRRVLNELRDLEGIPTAKLGIIYNGVNFGSFESDDLVLRPFDPHRLTLIIVANLIPYKGHDDLLQALRIAKDQILSDWQLLVVGEDLGIGPGLVKKAESFGISKNVKWLGKRKDVPLLLKQSDIGILCSHEEGFSNAIIEGMAAGLPMIVTDVGGNAEAVVHMKTGLVVPPSAHRELAEAIVFLATKKRERLSMGAEARKRALEAFGLSACVDRYEYVYQSLLRGKAPRRSLFQEIVASEG